MISYTKKGYKLLHDGCRALAKVEATGICIDEVHLDESIDKVTQKISRLDRRIRRSDVGKLWREQYGSKTNFSSNEQLGELVFGELGYDCPRLTKTGRYATDESTLSTIDHPVVKWFLKASKWRTTLSRSLRGFKREIVDGKIHPFFNLHLARTYRSSSNDPNFQSIPIRDPIIAMMVRSAFIARPGRQIVEVDYSGIEVRIAACYHHDPAMFAYIKDPTKDMHRDMAAEIFMLALDEVTKTVRYCGKNMFVFPQFYGDWYIDCARSLWEAINSMDLKTVSGVAMAKHLVSKGIRKRGELDPKARAVKGTFEYHIQQIEKRFWEDRFPVYNDWKQEWWEAYQAKGWMATKTGFVCQGWMKRNECINYAIQGSAFHCLLWSLSRMVLKELKRRKMKSLIVGQIHDSMVADVVPEELDEFLYLINRVMTVLLRRAWPWIIVPLEIEAEVSPVGGTWADKKEMAIPA